MSTVGYENTIVSFLNNILNGALTERINLFQDGERILRDPINKPLIRKQKHMQLESELYSPISDIAVGPFAFTGFRFADWDYDGYMRLLELDSLKEFIRTIKRKGKVLPGYNIHFNQNPRCLISFEIENTPDYKHNLGSMTNCSIMGKIGVYIDYNTRRLNRFYKYLNEMIRRKKTQIFKNVIFISKNNFDKIIYDLTAKINENSNLS